MSCRALHVRVEDKATETSNTIPLSCPVVKETCAGVESMVEVADKKKRNLPICILNEVNNRTNRLLLAGAGLLRSVHYVVVSEV